VYDSGDYPAVLRRALELSDYDRLAKDCLRARQEGRLLGVGLACYVELTGVGPFEGATVRVDAAGRITVFTGVPSQGQGLETTLAQVAADELGHTAAKLVLDHPVEAEPVVSDELLLAVSEERQLGRGEGLVKQREHEVVVEIRARTGGTLAVVARMQAYQGVRDGRRRSPPVVTLHGHGAEPRFDCRPSAPAA